MVADAPLEMWKLHILGAPLHERKTQIWKKTDTKKNRQSFKLGDTNQPPNP